MGSGLSVKRLLGNDARGDLSSCKLLGLSKKKCTKARMTKSKLMKSKRKSNAKRLGKALVRRRIIRKARAKLR